jgi:hypothetical protein
MTAEKQLALSHAYDCSNSTRASARLGRVNGMKERLTAMSLRHPACLLMFLTACSSMSTGTDPQNSYLERSVVQARYGISVTASVLDEREIEKIFGARLDQVGIQPVWLKIQNLSAHSYVLFLRSIDPDYFSPYEVARRSSSVSERSAKELYPFLRDNEIQRFITPGALVEGYVYTHLDEGLKAINVDLVGNRRIRSFNMAVEVPGLQADFADFDPSNIYETAAPQLSEYELRTWLAALPCCTVSEGGDPGDPLNLILIGELDDVRAALVSQRWDITAEITSASLRRIATAFLFGSRYRYAPISPLYVFGREQDMSFQKARAVIDERNHVRLWLAPVTHGGIPVWVGQISRDAGIKLSGRSWPPTTHVIDPAVDEARFFIEQDLLYSQRVHKIGLVEGVGAASVDAPRKNAEGDAYFTDGMRAVLFIGNRLTPIDQIEVLDWSLYQDLEPFRESLFQPRADRE